MRQALQRLSNLLVTAAPPHGKRSQWSTAPQPIRIGDAYAPLQGGHVETAVQSMPALQAARVRGLVNDDTSRADFSNGLRQLFAKVPGLQRLALKPFFWRSAPIYRRADNHAQLLPQAPGWQWPHAYPHPPEVPPSLYKLNQLRRLELSEEMTAAVCHAPPGLESLKLELGTLSELTARLPVRLPNVQTLQITSTCERIPEAARIIEAAPRLQQLALRLQNYHSRLLQEPFDIQWPSGLRALHLELRQVPAARWHEDTGEIRNTFFGSMWQSLPTLKELTLTLCDVNCSLEALRLDMAVWRGRSQIEKLVIQGVQPTQKDLAAIKALLPRQARVSVEPVVE